MIGINYSNYNNASSVNSVYKYNYNRMTSQFSPDNTAGVNNNGNKSNYINSKAASYMQEIKNNARNLYENMSFTGQSAAFKMIAESSNNEVLTASSSSETRGSFDETDIEVEQVASGQVNEGRALKASERYGDDSGQRQFEIESNGNRSQFRIEVTNRDTNKSIQQKMASAINRGNTGVTASVSSRGGSSTLTVRSENTGDNANNRFSIRDVSGSLVADTGVNNVSREAQNAVYRVNGGGTRTSETNDINLGNGVTATLRQASSDPVTVSAARNTSRDTGRVRNMVDSYNNLLSTARSGNNGNNRLSRELTAAANAYSNSLDEIGINVNKDGGLSINSEKLTTAAEDGSLERFFTPERPVSYGFAGRMANIARNVDRNPVGYVEGTAVDRNNTEDYLNSNINSIFNGGVFNSKSFNTDMNYNYQNIGYLLNMFA